MVASFAGVELVLDEDMREHIAGILRRRWAARTEFSAEAIEEANRKQAMVPRGAVVLPPVGTAPGGGAARTAARAAGDVARCAPGAAVP